MVRAGEAAARAALPRIRQWFPAGQPEQPPAVPAPPEQTDASGAVALSTE
jgi:hypothetical protein